MEHLLPHSYVKTDSKVEGVTVYKPPPPPADSTPHHGFECPQCAGTMAYAALDGGITCSFCGYHETMPLETVGKSAETFEFTTEVVQQSAQGWGIARKEVECRACAGRLVTSVGELTAVCAFCGSTNIIHHKAHQEVLRPRFLIPFALNDEQVTAKLKQWLGKGGWLTPSKLKQTAAVGGLTPIYLPYWTFDARAVATWKAEVGHKETNNLGGRTQSTTVWKAQSGEVDQPFTNVQVNGSEHISGARFGRIQEFDMNALVPYDPKYLTGVRAQAYEVPLEKAWAKARHRLRDLTKQRCKAQIEGTDIENFVMDLDFQDESWRYMLVPVYIATYFYNNKTHQLLINGQTGKIAGSRPTDWTKLIATALLPMLAGTLLMLFQWLIGISDSNFLSLLSGLLFALGILLGGYFGYRAMEMSNG